MWIVIVKQRLFVSERVCVAGSSPKHDDNTPLGVIMITGAVFLMALADALVKLVSADLTLWQIYTTRGAVAVLILSAAMRWRGVALRPGRPHWVYLRGVLLVAMWIAYYSSLPVLPLSVAAVALYTTPLFIALLSAVAIGEPVGLRRWVAIASGFVGVLVILRPGTEAFSWFTVLPILAAVLYACAMILTRTKCLDEAPLGLALALNVSLLMAGIVGSLLLVVLDLSGEQSAVYPFVLGSWVEMGAGEWSIALLLGTLIAVYGSLVANAYQVAAPSVVATFDYSYLVFAAFWGLVLFSEVPDTGTVVGMILISVAGFLAVARPASVAVTQSTEVQRVP